MSFLRNIPLMEEDGIEDPVGMSGVKLEANFHVITAQIGAVEISLNVLKKQV